MKHECYGREREMVLEWRCTKCGESVSACSSWDEEVSTDRCSPVEMRKNLVVIDGLKKAGLDFVPMPVLNEEDKKGLLLKMIERIDLIENTAAGK